MAIQLTIDDRERAIIAELNTIGADPQLWQAQRLICGDFIITDTIVTQDRAQHVPILAIERKTYSDFARSMQDGRIHRIASLDSLRSDYPRMKIAVLLEGTRPHSDRESINGIPYKSIRTQINKLIFQYDIHVFETRDVGDTAKYLLDLVADISSFRLTAQALQRLSYVPPEIRVREFVESRDDAQAELRDAQQLAPAALPPIPTTPAPAIPHVVQRSNQLRDNRSIASTSRMRRRTDVDYVKSLFCYCSGIGVTTAEKLICSGISFSAFARGALPASCPNNLMKLSIRYRGERTQDMDIKILRQVGITDQMAKELLQFASSVVESTSATTSSMTSSTTLSLPILCELTQSQMQSFRFKGRLQKMLMTNIYKYLHYGECV